MILEPLKAVSKKFKNQIDSYRILAYHKSAASGAQKLIKTFKNVEPGLEKRCQEYALDIFKHLVFQYDIHALSLFNGGFQEGFIPQSYYTSVIVPYFSGQYSRIANMRLLESKFFDSSLLPNLAFHHQGRFYNQHYHPLDDKFVKNYLFKDHNLIVFKLDSSSKSKGVFIFNKQNFSQEKIKSLGTGVFQFFIQQHPALDQINHYSVATLRLTTVSKNTSIKLKASHFRIGFGKTPIIAAANDFIFTGVDIKSGRLTFGVDTDFNRHLDHPHPQIYYQDISIPFFHKAVQIVLELHKKIPFIYCIGWDVAIGVDGAIWIIEFNAVGNGVFLHQLFDGPVFQSLHWEKVATKELQAPIFL